MNTHSLARLTPRGRALLVARMRDGQRPEEAAQAAGGSVRTAYKWLHRFRTEGTAGLLDRTSRPRASPHATPDALVQEMIALRRERRTYREIALRLGCATSTVARLLAKAGHARLPELEPAPPVVRYEAENPGDLLHLDIKKLGRFQRPGHRITGDRTTSSDGAGWEYVHVAIDDHSRVAFSNILPDETARSACRALMAAIRYYRTLGVHFSRLLTDNGSAYRSRAFARLVRRLGMRHRFTRPYTPRTNGKAERLIQTALREWAYARRYETSEQRSAHLPHWLHHYNWHRPHASLGYKPPITRIPIPLNNVLGLHTCGFAGVGRCLHRQTLRLPPGAQEGAADASARGLPVRDLVRVDVVQLRHFGQCLAPRTAASATFALKVAAWLRLDRRFMECFNFRLPARTQGRFATDQPV